MSDRRDAQKAEEHRSPPNNLEAEQALPGALPVNNEALHLVATCLEPDHFSLPVHGRIYDAVMHFVGRREIANPVALRAYFENDEALKEAGGGQYLARPAGSAVTVINAEHYGRAVHDLYLRRQLIFLAEDIRDTPYDAPLDQPPREQVEGVESKLHELLEGVTGTRTERRTIGETAFEAAEAVQRAYQADGKLLALPVGIRSVEESFGGIQAPDMIVLGERPGMGKTGMALGIAFAVAKAGHAVFCASLEMSSEQHGKRARSIRTDIEHHMLQTGRVKQPAFDELFKTVKGLGEIPLVVGDTGGQTPDYIERSARRLKRRNRLDLLIVDHLQLKRSPREVRPQNRVQQISNFTGRMKALAKELHVPVLLLSQLNRAGERSDNKVPQLSDLRDSGSIEQNADSILSLYRKAYYFAREEPDEVDHVAHGDWKEMMEKVAEKGGVMQRKLATDRSGKWRFSGSEQPRATRTRCAAGGGTHEHSCDDAGMGQRSLRGQPTAAAVGARRLR